MTNFSWTVPIFFGSFLFLFFLGIGLFSIYKNKNEQKEIDKFLQTLKTNDIVVLSNLQMTCEQGSNRITISPFDECDVYIFEYYIV